MKTTITTEYTIQRMNSSYNGNPRYSLHMPDGEIIGSTRPDSSIAYGPVPNHEGRMCDITLHITPTGRTYVESVEPVKAA